MTNNVEHVIIARKNGRPSLLSHCGFNDNIKHVDWHTSEGVRSRLLGKLRLPFIVTTRLRFSSRVKLFSRTASNCDAKQMCLCFSENYFITQTERRKSVQGQFYEHKSSAVLSEWRKGMWALSIQCEMAFNVISPFENIILLMVGMHQ